MIIGKPAPFVSALLLPDDAIRAHQPSCGMSAMPRTCWPLCHGRFGDELHLLGALWSRASLGTYSLAALSWMFRHSKVPWDQLLRPVCASFSGTMASPREPRHR